MTVIKLNTVLAVSLVSLVPVAPAIADPFKVLDEVEWYLGIDAGVSKADGEVAIGGPTIGAYGNRPLVDFEDLQLVTGASVGADIPGPLRFELEYRERELSTDSGFRQGGNELSQDFYSLSGTSENSTLMLVGFADFNQGGRLQPYLKAGIGAALNEVTATESGALFSDVWMGTNQQGAIYSGVYYPAEDSTDFAWEVGGGLGIPLTDRATLDFEYQYLDAGEAQTVNNALGDSILFDDLSAHEATVGLRVKF